jgi:hypothetical protein
MILALKISLLIQHDGRRTTERSLSGGIRKGQHYHYVARDCRHLKNERLLATRGTRPILEAIQDVTGERGRKRQQMGTILHLLQQRRPMIDYTNSPKLYQFLSVPKLPQRHWSDGTGWILAECLHRQVELKTTEVIVAAMYISMSCDEVTSIDNSLWISIHCYIVQN